MSDLGSRPDCDQRSGAQQQSGEAAARSGAGGQRDDPASWDQGKWEHREGDTNAPRGEDYARQARVGQTGYSAFGTGGQVGAGTGPTGIGTQSDRFDTSGQYGGPERLATDQSTGRAEAGRGAQDDDVYPSSGPGGAGKPSMTRVMAVLLAQADVKGVGALGTSEKLAGKITRDPGKQARGRDRELSSLNSESWAEAI
ncbi:hypothetical protein BJV78DRAFT_1156078 [Lactifluus subvellereus]|nr:hypothetical protein BJV78DRAFT_1156078 [Lactifluus subvellereus]